MYLSSPSNKHPVLETLKHLIEEGSVPVVGYVFGVANKIFGKEWGLTADDTQHARVHNFKIKQDVKPEEIVLKGEEF